MLLVTFNQDWADEFSVYGLSIMSESSYAQLIAWAKNANWYFGTNEGFHDDDITDGFSIKTIDAQEEEVLRDCIFGASNTFGIFPNWEDMIYSEIYDRHEIVQNDGGYSVSLTDTGEEIAFGFGSFDEANEWLHSRVESLLNNS